MGTGLCASLCSLVLPRAPRVYNPRRIKKKKCLLFEKCTSQGEKYIDFAWSIGHSQTKEERTLIELHEMGEKKWELFCENNLGFTAHFSVNP